MLRHVPGVSNWAVQVAYSGECFIEFLKLWHSMDQNQIEVAVYDFAYPLFMFLLVLFLHQNVSQATHHLGTVVLVVNVLKGRDKLEREALATKRKEFDDEYIRVKFIQRRQKHGLSCITHFREAA